MADKQTIDVLISTIGQMEPDEARAVIRSAQDILYLKENESTIKKFIDLIRQHIGDIEKKSDEGKIAFYLCIYFLNSHYYIPLEKLQPVFNRKISWIKFCKAKVIRALKSKRKTDFEKKMYNYYTIIHNNINQ